MTPDDAGSIDTSAVTQLEKDAATAKVGLASATQEAVKAKEDENKALGEERNLLKEQTKERQDFAANHPFPHPDIKPWTQKPPENDPIRSFGSWASALGILAGAITKTGLASSLNASAAAMNAFRQNDLDAYNEAKSAWKENTDIAIKQADWEAKSYQNAWDLMKTDQAAGITALDIAARQAGNEGLIAAIKAGNYKEAWEISKGIADFALSAPEKRDKLAAIADTNARIVQLNQEWLKAHPEAQGKVPADVALANRTQAQREATVKPTVDPLDLKWEILTDKDGTAYRYNPVTGEATTLDKEPYKPKSARKLSSSATGGGGLTADATDLTAMEYLITGKMTGFGMGGVEDREAVINRAADIAKNTFNMTPEQVAALPADYKAKALSLSRQVTWRDSVDRISNTVENNMQMVLDYGKKLGLTDLRMLNKAILAGEHQANNPDEAAYANALTTVAREYERATVAPESRAQLHVAALNHAEAVLSNSSSIDALQATFESMRRDISGQKKAADEKINDLEGQLKSIGTNLKENKDGGSMSFANEHEAVAAEKAGKIKIGDIITIAGKKVKVSQ